MEIKPKDIQDLIALGSTPGMDSRLLPSFVDRDYINRCGSWDELMRPLSNEEVISVYKALIRLEGEFNWLGGSVASGIRVYRVIRKRGLDDDYQLADYGLQNSDNPYVPFGSHYPGRRTTVDYFEYKKTQAGRRAKKLEEDRKFSERVVGRKEKRAAAIAELRKLSYEDRGSIRAEYLQKYEDASPRERLEVMIAEEKYPPELFPAEWISLTEEQINELPVDLLKKLYDKLSSKTKGEWRKFARKLQKFDRLRQYDI